MDDGDGVYCAFRLVRNGWPTWLTLSYTSTGGSLAVSSAERRSWVSRLGSPRYASSSMFPSWYLPGAPLPSEF